MARITVDDCIKFFPNRFELTLAATNRARQLALGASPLVEANKDKPCVIALRDRPGQGGRGAPQPAGAHAPGSLN